MSALPQLRRADREMSAAEAWAFLERGFSGRLGTVGAGGWPYVTPLLYVVIDRRIWVHGAAARGHLRANIEANGLACFEVDAPGDVFAYGRFECDSAVAYASVIAFGRIGVAEDRAAKQRFCEALMAKYAPAIEGRPKSFFPRLGGITVYAMEVERITGKRLPLPALGEQWPARDRTASPNAKAPGG